MKRIPLNVILLSALLATSHASYSQSLLNQGALVLGDRPSSQIDCQRLVYNVSGNRGLLDPIDAQSLNGGHVIGWAAKGEGEGSLVFGNGALGEGRHSIAMGSCSYSRFVADPRLGSDQFGSATSFGRFAFAEGQLVMAMGDYATVVGGYQNTAIGPFSFIGNSIQSSSFGGAYIEGASQATGIGLSAVLDGAHGAVAIGFNSAARGVAEANTVSFGATAIPEYGAPQFTRRLINVGDGINATDAATVGQVQLATKGISSHIYRVEGTISGLSRTLSSTAGRVSLIINDLSTIGARFESIQSSLTTLTTDGLVTSARIEGLAIDAKATADVAAATATEALDLGKANSAKLAEHDTVLTQHDQRITQAQATADEAATVAGEAQYTADLALSGVGKLSTRVSAMDHRLYAVEEQVSQLDGRVGALEQSTARDRIEARAGIAAVSAMSMPLPSLSTGERALVLGFGNFKGQSALAAGLAYAPRAGSLLSMRLGTSRSGTALAAGASVKF